MNQGNEDIPNRFKLPPWAWMLLGAIIASLVFLGYGQVDLLFQASNLRYCG